jgi:hypothetical protein
MSKDQCSSIAAYAMVEADGIGAFVMRRRANSRSAQYIVPGDNAVGHER